MCYACMLSHFQLFVTLWIITRRLLCPQDSLGKNTGVGCHALLQGSSQPRDPTCISHTSCIGSQVLHH